MKKNVLIIFVILFIFLFCLGGYALYKQLNNNENNNESPNVLNLKKDIVTEIDKDNVKKNTYYSVTLKNDDKSEIVKVKAGKEVDFKEASAFKYDFPYNHYTFVGWELNGSIISENYTVNEDITLKAMFKNNNTNVKEYIFDTIEEWNDNNSIPYFSANQSSIYLKYNTNDIKIEILIGKENYTKVNDEIIKDEYINYSARVFKFNNYYIVEYDNINSQFSNKHIIVLNKNGKLIGELHNDSGIGDKTFSSEKNEIYLSDENVAHTSLINRLNRSKIYTIDEDKLKCTNFYSDKIFIHSFYSANTQFMFAYSTQYEYGNDSSGENIYAYTCNTTNCKGYEVVDNEALISDEHYYIYNYKNGTKTTIESNIFGELSYIHPNVETGIHDNLNYISIYNQEEEQYYIYNRENKKIVKQLSSKPEYINLNNNIYYITHTDISKEKGTTIEIYDNFFQKLWTITGLENYDFVINSDNSITFNASIEGVYVLLDQNMKLIRESKVYQSVNAIKNHIIIIDNNIVKILNLNNEVIAQFDKLPDIYNNNPHCYFLNESKEIKVTIYGIRTTNHIDYYYNIDTKETRIVEN